MKAGNSHNKNYSKKNLIRVLCMGTMLGLVTACNGGGSGGTTSSSGGVASVSTTDSTVSVPADGQIKTPASAYIDLQPNSSDSSQNSNSSNNGNNNTNNSNSSVHSIPKATSFAATSSSGNNCFSLVTAANGSSYTSTQNSQAYYSTATVSYTIKNTCATAQTMSGLQVNVNGLTINGKAVSINYIEQAQGSPYLTLTYTSSGTNITTNLSTPSCSGAYCDWAAMPANGTRAFTINVFVNAAIRSMAVGNVNISGSTPPPPPATGNLAVNVNTSALSTICTSSTNCKIGVNVLDPTGAIFKTISVNPSESPNYTITYTNLLTGNYTLAVNTNSYPSGSGSSINYTYNPTSGIVQVNSNATTNSSVNFNYTAPIATGSLAIKTGTISETSTFQNIGILTGTATRAKTKTIYAFNVGINGTTTINNLPAGDTYTVTLQSIGDPASGVYYSVAPVQTTVSANTSVTVNLPFSKTTASQYNVIFNVTGLPTTGVPTQTIAFASSNTSLKYNSDTLNSATYKFLNSESAIAVTLATPTGYTLTYTPNVITPSVKNFTVTYTAITPPSSSRLTTQNDQIVDASGNIVKLKGINWFGFNNGDMLNGMWNYDGLSGDFETTVLRLKALGFNAVRLPFSFANLNGSIQSTYNRNGLTPATTTQLIANLTNPSYSISGKTFPSLNYTSGQTYSNQYLPNTTVMARFLYVIDFFARNGFYVLVDNHTEDNSMTSNSTQWTTNWKNLAASIQNGMPASSSLKVMYDIRNEPDAVGYNWTQMGPIYLSAMDAINSVTNGNNLFFIEGSGQGGINANWGDGFATNTTVIQQYGLSNPNQFFTSLASKSYLNQVVLSPHIYPPTITNASSAYSGSGLYNRLSTSFGTLAKTGYLANGVYHKFPIAIGEFGSFFTDSRDLSFFTSFANYLNNNNDAVDGLHNPIDNWFYWSYNPNSGDTGGIVGNDWTTVQWVKINYLSFGTISGTTTNTNGIGLSPWYK